MDRTIRRTRSGGIAVVSDYLFRDLADRQSEIQGSLQYGYEPWGVYLGTWASSVNPMTSEGEIEIWWWLAGRICGHRDRLGPGCRVLPLPGDDLEPEKDHVEPKLGLSHEFAGLPLMPRVSASVHYSPDLYLWVGDAIYVDGAVGMSLKKTCWAGDPELRGHRRRRRLRRLTIRWIRDRRHYSSVIGTNSFSCSG
jgi:hypothetical protein